MRGLKRILFSTTLAALVMLPALGQDGTINSLTFNGISFSYDHALGDSVNIVNEGDDRTDPAQPGGPQPPHVAFYLYDDPANSVGTAAADASVTVYNVARLAGYGDYQAEVERLRTLIETQGDLSAFERASAADQGNETTLPFLPIYPAAQVIRARTGYVQTAQLSGIAYVTVYRQDASPFTADEFIYTVQALSSDGAYYISAIQQVDIAAFPASLESVDLDAFMATIDAYFAESIASINDAAESDFTPSPVLLDALVRSFSIGTLSTGDGAAPVPAQPTETPVANADPTLRGLAGTWNLVSYGDPNTPTPAVPDVAATLTFDGVNGLNGNVGCNSFGGSFEYADNTITIGPVASTMMACPEAIMMQENTVFRAFEGASTFEIDGDTLTITYTNEDGTPGALTFTRAA
ncbi:MAG: META domain-containing protein [bacterium]|nr:META domain-containing protein [bacterium]